MRKHYLDNVRWITVLLVLFYHVIYIFNASGVLGGIGSFAEKQYQDAIMYFVYPWFMVLLFVVAGISSRLYLDKHEDKQFIKDRTQKLLVPSTLGVFVLQWVTGYFGMKAGGAFEDIPSFLRYPISALSGIGPLWFIQMLWLFSMVLVLIRKIDKNDIFYCVCAKCPLPIVLLMFIPIWISSKLLNMPVITTYRFGIYFVSFLLGYFIFSHEEIMYNVEKIRKPMLALFFAGGVAYTIYYFGECPTSDKVLQSLITNLYLWIAVIAILSNAKAMLNRSTPFTRYITKSSFGLYIVHYPVLVVIAYFLYNKTQLSPAPIYIISFIGEILGSVLLFEMIKRIPVIRYLVLGMKNKRKV